MVNSHFVNISLIIAAFFSVLLVIFPELDIAFSSIFFEDSDGFVHKGNFFVYQIYKILPLFTKIFTVFCLFYLVYIGTKNTSLRGAQGATWQFRKAALLTPEIGSSPTASRNDGSIFNFGKVVRSGVFFLFIAAIIGPGIVVNSVFKENFGRARPAQITVFKGAKEFTPAFKITDQCEKNCSFSSGHAAMAFFFSALAYVFGMAYFNMIYASGLLFGSAVGLSRIMMGGHFLSDVIVSAFLVLFLNHIIFILWQRVIKNSKR
jgi:lipid A 4'-phosphatase